MTSSIYSVALTRRLLIEEGVCRVIMYPKLRCHISAMKSGRELKALRGQLEAAAGKLVNRIHSNIEALTVDYSGVYSLLVNNDDAILTFILSINSRPGDGGIDAILNKIIFRYDSTVVQLHDNVIGRYIRKYECAAMGIVVAPDMDRFADGAFVAARADEAENVVLLSSINDIQFYILRIAVNSLYGEPPSYFELPYSANGERITF
ncbi:hypothetical protein C2G38_2223525 [Gigaspora rosea]|uniref:Uncharacterized protein n=1 Tax=Gigaspora rosea TaxID=44941 RepID=A0A397U5H9_9GLOM|nr:hypothetical protein C2G38_2223525 [Gigaspora rosea]